MALSAHHERRFSLTPSLSRSRVWIESFVIVDSSKSVASSASKSFESRR